MVTLNTIYLIVLAMFLIGMMIVQHNRGTIQLLSFRNTFLLGTILFQCSSGAFAMHSYDPNVPINLPGRTGMIFCLWLTIYIVIFLFVYHNGLVVKKLGQRMPMPLSNDNSIPLLSLGIYLTILAAVLKLGLLALSAMGMNVGLAYILGHISAMGCGTVACGVLVIAFVRRGFNPVMLLTALVTLGANLLIAVAQSSSRRPLVSMIMGMIWAVFYYRLRVMSASKIILWFILLGIGPIILLALYSTTRHLERVGSRSIASQVRNVIERGDLVSGLIAMGRGQNAGDCSMWLLENHPKYFPYRHLNTFVYFLTYPVPRVWWTTKPLTTAQLMPEQAKMQGVRIGEYNIGPGIVGQSAAEGGMYALVFYAIWFGLAIRFLDVWLLTLLDNPVGVMVLGSALGQILATPRGEMGSFLALAVLSIVLVLIIVWIPTVLLWPNQAELREQRRNRFAMSEQ